MVKWTDHALTQLRHIHDHIAQDSEIYAKRVTEALVSKTIALNEFPRLGRRVPELYEETIREVSLYSYRIIYEIKPANIDVIAVIHKRRDLMPDELLRTTGDR